VFQVYRTAPAALSIKHWAWG